MNSVLSVSVSGRRKARSANVWQNALSFAVRSASTGSTPLRSDNFATTYPAVSSAPSVVAASHSFDMVVPRSQPRLLSSGGNAASITATSGNFSGVRCCAGIGSTARPGRFQFREINADVGRVFGFMSLTPCFAFENSNLIGYARPASRNTLALYSVLSPEVTHASITGFLLSLTHRRRAWLVFTTNSYEPVSGAHTEPCHRIQNVFGLNFSFGSGSAFGPSVPKSKFTSGSSRSTNRLS